MISVPDGHRLDHENIYKRQKNGLQWTLWEQLDDLDFADDLALLSHNPRQIQGKPSLIETTAAMLGLNVNKGKTKITKINCKNNKPIYTTRGRPS